MKKYYGTILIVQFALMATFLIFAFAQRTAAIKSKELTVSIQEQAIRFQAVAEEAERRAVFAAEEAKRQAELARLNLQLARKAAEDCEKRK
jgi:hypothetical protein